MEVFFYFKLIIWKKDFIDIFDKKRKMKNKKTRDYQKWINFVSSLKEKQKPKRQQKKNWKLILFKQNNVKVFLDI